MIKLVIFDLDGTLVNAYPAVSQSVNYTLNSLGFRSRSYAQIKRSVGGGDRMLLAHFIGEPLADKAIDIYRPHHTKALQAKGGVKLLPGAAEILRFLKAKKYKLGLASNRPTRFTRIILRKLGILKYFNKVLCADKVRRPKPHPDMLEAVVKCLKVNKREALYIGDMTIDINCGRRAAIRVAAVSTGSSTKKELKGLKPWRIMGKISELKKIVAPLRLDGHAAGSY